VFTPGARTHWHRHHGGQLLIATHGIDYVIAQHGHGAVVRGGQSVWTPASEIHWHGAGPDSLFTRTAISFGPTEWLDEVSDDQYRHCIREARWELR
jgi:quercetin dioxygenase-like cupin family protein